MFDQQHQFGFFCFVICLISGCDCGQHADTENGAVSALKPPDIIFAAQGTSKIPIGISCEKLLKTNIPSSSKESYGATYYKFQREGIQVGCRDGVVVGVFLYFHSNEYTPFHGRTDRDIGAESTIRDVICSYGMPMAISNSIDTRFGKRRDIMFVDLRYDPQGIEFIFSGGTLESINTFLPRTNLPLDLRSDIGDTTEIRNIDCGSKNGDDRSSF